MRGSGWKRSETRDLTWCFLYCGCPGVVWVRHQEEIRICRPVRVSCYLICQCFSYEWPRLSFAPLSASPPLSRFCASATICTQECGSPTDRPFSCDCASSHDCLSGCCLDGTCAAEKKACDDPCKAVLNRPLDCPCQTVGSCDSGCCDFSAAPGADDGECKAESVCTSACAGRTGRPIGCSCAASDSCDSGCCSGNGVCDADVNCPTPAKCALAEGRANNCPCSHSWMCTSQWCEDLVCVEH